MRIQVGSRVKFLNDVGGGKVLRFTDDKMAIVEGEDGFEIPVLVTDLLLDTGAAYGLNDDEPVVVEENIPTPTKEIKPEASFEEKKFLKYSGEVFLAIVPQNDQLLHVTNFDLYLVNDSNYSFNYCISLKDGRISTLLATGIIESDTKIVVEEFSQTSVSKIKSFHLQGIHFKEGLFEVITPIDLQKSIEGISFYKINHFSENDYFHQKAILLKQEDAKENSMDEAIEQLKDSDIAKVIDVKENKESKAELKSPKNTNLEEVDLHIEEIVEITKGLSNGEIVNIQMSRFETALETAIRSKSQRIVFIHGVGNGRLKHELRKKLDGKYSYLRYQDASFKEYGYGATLVYLQ